MTGREAGEGICPFFFFFCWFIKLKHGPFFVTTQKMLSQGGVCYLVSPIFFCYLLQVCQVKARRQGQLWWLRFFFLLFSHTILLCARSNIRMVWCHFGFSLDRALAFVLFKNRPKRPVFFCAHFSPSVLLVIVVPKDSCGTDRLCLKITMGARWRESKEGGAGRWEFYHPQGSRYEIHKNKKNFKIFHLYPFKPQV